MGPSRVFNALNGEEVKRAILHEIEHAFEQVADFRPSIAIPVLRWSWECKISCYPRDPQDINLKAGGERIADDATEAERAAATETILEGMGACGAEGMEAPDQIRERVGLPVPTLRRDPRTGQYVDVMETKEPPADEWTPPGVRGSVIDKGPARLRDKK